MEKEPGRGSSGLPEFICVALSFLDDRWKNGFPTGDTFTLVCEPASTTFPSVGAASNRFEVVFAAEDKHWLTRSGSEAKANVAVQVAPGRVSAEIRLPANVGQAARAASGLLVWSTFHGRAEAKARFHFPDVCAE